MNINNNLIEFKRNTGIIKLKFLYELKIQYKYLLIVILGIIFGTAIAFLQKNTGIYSVGIAGITQGFARLSKTIMTLDNASEQTIDLVFNLIFWGLYLFMNIPLLIFAYFKIGKHFALMTITYLVVVNVFGFLIGFIPNINEIFIFGPTHTENPELVKNNVAVLDWNNQQDLTRTVSLLFYSLAYIPTTGFILSSLYIMGASKGGADPISVYYSITKQKQLGNIIIIINISGLIIANLIGSFIPGYLVDQNAGFSRFFSPNMLCSTIYVLGSGFLINYLFPKNKPISIAIYSKKSKAIEEKLKAINYRYSILKIENDVAQKIEVICTYGQFSKVHSQIRKGDQQALIFTDIIRGIDGRIKLENNTKLKSKKENK